MSGAVILPGHRSEAINTIRRPRAAAAGRPTPPRRNSVHRDEDARQLGFTRGLVPSAVLYEYLCRPAVSGWGLDWFERGWIQTHFRRPVFHGQVVSVESEPIERVEGDRPGLAAELTCRTEDGTVVATASVGLADHPMAVPRGRYLAVPRCSPEYRPVASPVAFAAVDQLGSVERRVSLDKSVAWLSQLSGDPGAYHTLGVAPASDMVRDANMLFEANFKLGPWLHVETEATHFSAPCEGELVSVRGSVVDVYERNNNQFAELDLMVVADGRRAVAHLLQTVVWRLAAATEMLAGSPNEVAPASS